MAKRLAANGVDTTCTAPQNIAAAGRIVDPAAARLSTRWLGFLFSADVSEYPNRPRKAYA
jgi:hypothetical protein